MKKAELEYEIEEKQSEIAELRAELEKTKKKLAEKQRRETMKKDGARMASDMEILFGEFEKKGFSKEDIFRLMEIGIRANVHN
jgi:predicted RNase H-like nuclease (RuvC/YqgF family)